MGKQYHRNYHKIITKFSFTIFLYSFLVYENLFMKFLIYFHVLFKYV